MTPEPWWVEALASDKPMVTTRNWKQYGGLNIVMNTAALLEMIEFGPGASFAECCRANGTLKPGE